MLNRTDECVAELAEFINTTVSGSIGPHQALKQYLVPETNTGNVLKSFLPEGYQGRVFSRSAKEAKQFPPGKDLPSNLLLGLACLCIFDLVLWTSLHCAPTKTAADKRVHEAGLGFEIMYCIAAGLGG